MNFRILIPYWGNDPRYSALLTAWFTAYRALGLPHQVTIITDQHTAPRSTPYWIENYHTPEYDPAYPFDHKGDIVCAAIQRILDPVLVLDADAVIQHDPEPLLRQLMGVPFAMPADEGALGRHLRNRHAQETAIPKRCAGVLWFGSSYQRETLVRDYRLAFQELSSGLWYEERRLREQHAWSVVAFHRNAPFLPRTLNWLAANTRNGPNLDAAIYHNVGQRKFGLVKPILTA